ncbi:hypothetical protein [Aeromicrobium piscarium]|uniref:Uncharacterized protein n=1 Tax=Aeromicrobium piscarium TaxID=2590901 RepID=A0A554SFQ6_9ACTN|nr:hypothetical protein [Aeromicrobium piscarium]TSD65187.1 hypothetical protein FNM00_05635 [Aeromicrobium piscarium]
MNQPNPGPSWDVDRSGAPKRPSFASNFTPQPPIERPRRVTVAVWLVLTAVVIFLALTALAAWQFGDVRDTVTEALPTDLEADYTDGEIRRAVRVLIGVVAGLGFLLTLMQAVTIRSVARRRSGSARVLFVISVVLYLPLAVLSTSIRALGRGDLAASAVAVLCLVVAVVLVCTPAVSAWWRQPDRRDPAPLIRRDETAPEHPVASPPDAQVTEDDPEDLNRR